MGKHESIIANHERINGSKQGNDNFKSNLGGYTNTSAGSHFRKKAKYIKRTNIPKEIKPKGEDTNG